MLRAENISSFLQPQNRKSAHDIVSGRQLEFRLGFTNEELVSFKHLYLTACRGLLLPCAAAFYRNFVVLEPTTYCKWTRKRLSRGSGEYEGRSPSVPRKVCEKENAPA
jgi:hypothetical protein